MKRWQQYHQPLSRSTFPNTARVEIIEQPAALARMSETPSVNRWRLSHRPPRALRKARLDNISIVPASLLPQQARYQALANGLPEGNVLIIFPTTVPGELQVLEKTAALFEARGHHVTILPIDDLSLM